VAASAAALAGGGTAIDEYANHQGPPLPAPVQQVETQPVEQDTDADPTPPPIAEAPPAPADEFAPTGAPDTSSAPPAFSPPPQGSEMGVAGGGPSSAGGSEFTP
jgi:hypothetical protein